MAAGRTGVQEPSFLKPRSVILAFSLLVLLSTHTLADPALFAYRLEDVSKSTENGVFVVGNEGTFTLLFFGVNLTEETFIQFTDDEESCQPKATSTLLGGGNIVFPNSSSLENSSRGIDLPSLVVTFDQVSAKTTLYFCVFESSSSVAVHQGADPLLKIIVSPGVLPLWVEIIFIIGLMILSGLFSGLNLGLMALDPTTLKIIQESGTKRQKWCAKTIYRVRKHGNYLLCTLLLGNVLVNSTLTILLDTVLPSGLYAVVASTMAIVIFGEIIPQAICSRHGLVIGAYTIVLTYVFMFLTLPLSLPLSLILNLVLGKEIGAVYNREQLLELLKVTEGRHGLEQHEVDIISGALEFKKKTAEDVMTTFHNTYFLSNEAVLDFKTMRDVHQSGFSRIPVYENHKHNIVGLLYVRDLAFVDPDDQTPLANLLDFYKHELKFVWHDTNLDELLQGFAEGKCHMAIVQKVNNETEGDPFYEVVGVVTLEDIVEEILQREIVDETDRFLDNRTLKPITRERKHVDVADFMEPAAEATILSSHQRLAAYQFLSTSLEPFHQDRISSNVLKRLLKRGVVRRIPAAPPSAEGEGGGHTLYQAGSPASYFVLILEGCMEVIIGKDGLDFESRSFSHFGAQALMATYEENQCEYIPDFTVTPVTDCLVIIITRHQYEAARKATIFETQCAATGQSGSRTDLFSHEWEMAETKDIETCQSSASGLSSITKFLPKKPPLSAFKKRRASDKRELLTSTTSTSTGSCTEDSSESTTQSSSGVQKHTGAVHISVEVNRDEVFLPMFGGVDGNNDSERGIEMMEQSRNTYDASPVRYRTSGSTSPGEREQAASGDPWAPTGSVAGFSTQV